MKTIYMMIEVCFCVASTLFFALPKASAWKDESALAFAVFGLLVIIVIIKTKKVHLFEAIHFGKNELENHDFDD